MIIFYVSFFPRTRKRAIFWWTNSIPRIPDSTKTIQGARFGIESRKLIPSSPDDSVALLARWKGASPRIQSYRVKIAIESTLSTRLPVVGQKGWPLVVSPSPPTGEDRRSPVDSSRESERIVEGKVRGLFAFLFFICDCFFFSFKWFFNFFNWRNVQRLNWGMVLYICAIFVCWSRCTILFLTVKFVWLISGII